MRGTKTPLQTSYMKGPIGAHESSQPETLYTLSHLAPFSYPGVKPPDPPGPFTTGLAPPPPPLPPSQQPPKKIQIMEAQTLMGSGDHLVAIQEETQKEMEAVEEIDLVKTIHIDYQQDKGITASLEEWVEAAVVNPLADLEEDMCC
ncbi:hypothetical protein Moror_14883 [Moniliophthora roreri MCA 2997]|uniref:Uncharacterized protein n=2 Tax=Moniliophthora roreri TaxID=221103 RepID=V2WLU9_MONRO|nr:hypothetical protein Moror_14883 [Moniliophthora roreri MCA 2997]